MKRIYIAGPYTQGDVAVNVKTAMDMAGRLIYHGFAPYVPHLSHFLHMNHQKSYKTWMGVGIEWLEQCNAILRLPGPSDGADYEVGWARGGNIPVFYSLANLLEALK